MKTYEQGLRDAAALMVDTAKGYEADVERQNRALNWTGPRKNPVSAPHRLLALTHEKAVLLRGQAQRILDLQKHQ